MSDDQHGIYKLIVAIHGEVTAANAKLDALNGRMERHEDDDHERHKALSEANAAVADRVTSLETTRTKGGAMLYLVGVVPGVLSFALLVYGLLSGATKAQ